MKRVVILMVLMALTSHAQYIGSVVGVDAAGNIIPTNGAASVRQLGAAAGLAVAAQAAVEAQLETTADLTATVVRIENKIASQQQDAIFQAHVVSFNRTVVPVTNCTVQIVQWDRSWQGTNYVGDIYVWFSAAPSNAPTIYATTALNGQWSPNATLYNSWPDTVSVVTSNGVFEAYQITVQLDPASISKFYRVDGLVAFSFANGSVLPIDGGLTMNGLPGITIDQIFNGHTNHFECGVLVTKP